MDSLCALIRHNSPWLPFVIFNVGIKCQTKKGCLDKGYCLIVLGAQGAGKPAFVKGSCYKYPGNEVLNEP